MEEKKYFLITNEWNTPYSKFLLIISAGKKQQLCPSLRWKGGVAIN
jgi:hypothetical protein